MKINSLIMAYVRQKATISILVVVVCFYFSNAEAQTYFDSLKTSLINEKNTKLRLTLLNRLTSGYLYRIPDSAIKYAEQEILEARQSNSDSALAIGLIQYGVIQRLSGNLSQAVYYGYESLRAAEKSSAKTPLATASYYLSTFYLESGDYNNAILYCHYARNIWITLIDTSFKYFQCPANIQLSPLPQYRYLATLTVLADLYEKNNHLDSALYYGSKAYRIANEHFRGYKFSNLTHILANIFSKKGDTGKALQLYHTSLKDAESDEIFIDVMRNCSRLAELFIRENQIDSSIYYARQAIAAQRFGYYPFARLEALNILASVYQSKGESDSASKYMQMANQAKDSLFGRQTIMQIQSLTFNERLNLLDKINQKKEFQQKIRSSILLSVLIAFIIISSLLYRSSIRQRKDKLSIQRAYEKLKSTQAQLIQSEKMASLGELTAGIAHEIQNPLNFVNNFSEVSNELMDEMKDAIEKGNYAELYAIADDVKKNLEKIHHHGKRADAIVKGMLQHSRNSSGQKEPTDINALCDEYLRLAYHGLRSKDKSFNADLVTDFDPAIGHINAVPQDIGRVLLNLINNAFYAVNEKAKSATGDYKPVVTVATRKTGQQVDITVHDNGNGIPENIREKIFQPFFTTKPTGQGTGLGLSLSYDMVKAHGGAIKVESTEEKGTTFTVQLPL